MSTQEYYRDGTRYDIGTIGRELPQPEGIFDLFMNIVRGTYWRMIPDIAIPTYGLWAGPGWSGGKRSSNVDWTVIPCMNESVKSASNPENCYSLVDAITKTHDWRYDQADKQHIIDKNDLA